jgi:hypothetical protein
MNRRDLLKAGVSILPVASRLGIGAVAAGNIVAPETRAEVPANELSQAASNSTLPWQRRIRRVGQLNMTEHDPAVMNVEAWADFWASVKADVVFISVTGILAYYQTKVRFHRKGKFLGDRDFFGEKARHARRRPHESRPQLGRLP